MKIECIYSFRKTKNQFKCNFLSLFPKNGKRKEFNIYVKRQLSVRADVGMQIESIND